MTTSNQLLKRALSGLAPTIGHSHSDDRQDATSNALAGLLIEQQTTNKHLESIATSLAAIADVLAAPTTDPSDAPEPASRSRVLKSLGW